ncbi:hypothetical protein PUR59_01450 [Streptomyces sp. SP18ES09]|uniref:hypothetical protein n=1 Tax=Streptomyces sp. SP18ES09 TaxID=3002532 RepID=UPI002E75C287|nr:hypothetical protein [Streptomyces sp. SP18ES09]MEE1813706.1 hypothetical protein [Streptomyces sp. SP18ES09]
MASTRLNFILDGRDQLSRVFDRAGDAATRMSRRVMVASINSDAAVRRFANNSVRSLSEMDTSNYSSAKAMEELKGAAISLAPAAIPIAAAFAPIAVNAGAAGLAVAAFGVALGGQIGPLGEAAEAEKKYSDAVAESGARSEEAVTAHADYVRQVGKLPAATREAAAALSVLKDEYKGWSDSLAERTMPPVTKGFAVLGALLPKLTPLVQGASHELDRLMTVIGGAVVSPGLDAFTDRLAGATTGAIRRANDALIHLMRTADSGQVGGTLSQFMAFAREQGPVVADTLRSVATALLNVLKAGSDVGVGMLSVVNGLAGLVAAVPPGAITALVQLAIAIKAVRLAAVGLAAGRAALVGFATTILAMRAAAAGSTGPVSALTAAFGALSRGAKLALAGTGIGLFVLALSELSQMGRQAPPDVDKLTLSLKQLNATGEATGEAAKSFGADLGGLYDKVRSLTDPSTTDQVQQAIVTLGGLGSWDSTPVKDAKDNLDAIDQALASLVSGGRAEQAAAALERLAAEYGQGGRDTAAFTGAMDAYQSALDDVAFEQDLVAQSMGLFGAQAVATKAKLDEQKASADGLRQSIQALNDVNRAGLGGQIAFEQALDATSEAAKKNAGVWGTNASTYNLTTEKGRTAATALTDLAAKTDAATAAARESGASWSTVNGIYDRGRTKLIASAQQMGLSEAAARRLADQILRTPDKTAKLKGDLEDLEAKLADAKKRLASVPDGRRAQLKAEISQLEAQVARAKGAIASVQGKTVSVMVQYRASHSGASDFTKSIGGYAGGGTPKPGEVAWVGENGPELVRFGRGGARVYDHQTSMGMVRQFGAGQDVGAGLMAGMFQSRTGVEQAARGMAAGVEAGVRSELEIASPSKKMIALAKDTGRGMIVGLTGTKAKIKATAMDLVKDVWAAWAGKKTNVDSDLVKMINKEHAKLQSLATKRDSLRSRLGSAQALLKSRIEERDRYAADVRSQARSDSGLSSLGLDAQQVTAGSIKQGLSQKLSKLRQFTRWISVLTKRGINRNLLRQVLAMGPEEGYAYASALVGMSTTDLKAVNSLQSQIDKESDTLGKRAASTMYDAGVNSAKGLVAGLKAQEKSVVDQMYRLAKAMEKAIKKALGIKSPSRVAHGIGLNFGQGLSGGTLASLPAVGRAVDTVASRMAGIRPLPGRAAAGLAAPTAAGGGTVNHFTIQGAVDPVGTAKAIERILLKQARTNGG